MHVKMILPSLVEAGSPGDRPIKYSLFPPLGLATLAGHLPSHWNVELVDQHVETLNLNDRPDLVLIEVYITNANRAYAIADHYRSLGARVLLGGLHVTSQTLEARAHADHLFLGPADHSFPEFLRDLQQGDPKPFYSSRKRDLHSLPPIRRDLIQRHHYLVPNSLVISRGCPHHCTFCYKDAFFSGGRSFYTQGLDQTLEDIQSLPGRHLYFLDDHLLGAPRFIAELFREMSSMDRLFQGASTIDAILRGDLIEKAVEAGLRSIFVGFESVNRQSLETSKKTQNLKSDAKEAISRLRSLGVRINGSFVFGLDGDGPDVFDRTVQWAVDQGLTTATFHIATPYPGTAFYDSIVSSGRLLHKHWERYDTRQVVFQPSGMSKEVLQEGYHRAYRDFYRWSNLWKSASVQRDPASRFRQFAYGIGWKKMEPLWNLLVRSGALPKSRQILETVLDAIPRTPHQRPIHQPKLKETA